ncbi:hypothetical protein [Dyadobacter sp. OTU695]|uniref:hypothetical protein n=1 Tax=Dyadobacter sp. OTU695 TaxID=3043860 RepID=UPI00313A8175
MSDQEPIGKRMLGQLRNHSEPYRPEAWEHFELFRAARNRRKRRMLYWLSAAAFLIILGTALLTTRIADRGKPVKYPVARKHMNGGHPGKAKTVPPDEATFGSIPTTEPHQPVKSEKIHSKPGKRFASPSDIENAARNQLTAYPSPVISNERTRDQARPDLLRSRPFSTLPARFSKLYISPPDRPIHPKPQPARIIRWGAALSQQSNRATHTDTELNFGVGGVLLLPLSAKIALISGVSGSKQSLNVEEPTRLTAAEGFAQLQHVRYQWVNLEIPLQVRYELRTFKNFGFTAAAGIALQGSVGQQADYLYKTRRTIETFAETAGGPVLLSTQTTEELSSVTENDKKHTLAVGSPLYFGLGVSYQWRNTTVEIEPFIKYPLGASTAERLQLTTVGVQLRLTSPLRKIFPQTGNSL